jgi:hypothetical protein
LHTILIEIEQYEVPDNRDRSRIPRVRSVTGSLLAFGVCLLLVPPLGIHDRAELCAVGFILSAFMTSFDVDVVRLLMRRPCASISEDFNPRRVNYLIFGLASLTVTPNIVMAFHTRL